MALIDIEILLQPISEEQPAGTDQSASPQYLQIIEAMREDDPFIQRESWEEVRVADWVKVQSLCEELLETKTKDLQLAVWLTEALFRSHGLEGLYEGLLLTHGLCHYYWEQYYPQLEDPNLLYRRTNILTKFFNKLDEKLRHLPLTQPQDTELSSYRWSDYLDASHVDRLEGPDKQAALTQGRATTELFSASLRNTPDSFYILLAEHLTLVIDALGQLEATVREQCEALRPMLEEPADADISFAQGREALQLLQQYIHRICSDRGIGKAETLSTEETQQVESGVDTIAVGVSTATTLQSRDDAYRALERIADFLERIEPHSPVPYLLRRAVKWGQMSAQELFHELYVNAPDLEQLYRLLGIEQPPSESSSSW